MNAHVVTSLVFVVALLSLFFPDILHHVWLVVAAFREAAAAAKE